MNEDTFNMEVRKFLKKVGVTSQREMEKAVREAMQAGSLVGNEKLKARMRLEVEGLNLGLAKQRLPPPPPGQTIPLKIVYDALKNRQHELLLRGQISSALNNAEILRRENKVRWLRELRGCPLLVPVLHSGREIHWH